jgi:cytoskeleton protein RodZ
MNPIQAHIPDEPNVVELSDSPGRRLRVLRQSKGWEIERVAIQLHLRPHLVEALEQDRYQDLPGPVFVMGYLRNYARLLGLDPEPLISAYRTAHPSPEPGPTQAREPRGRPATAKVRRSTRTDVGRGHILAKLISLGLLVAVIALLVLWWPDRREPGPSLGSDTPGLPLLPSEETAEGDLALEGPEPEVSLASPEPGIESRALALPGIGPERESAPAADTGPPLAPGAAPEAAVSGPAGPTIEPEPAATPEPTPAVPQSQAPTVAMSFTGTSWVDVRDASGKVILTGEMRKGDRRVLSGEPPYSFVIGNARAASVTVGDRPLDLGARGRGGVARFKLDPSSPE